MVENGVTLNVTGVNNSALCNNCSRGSIVVKQGASVVAKGVTYGVESDNGATSVLSVLGGSFTAIGGNSALEIPADFSGNTVYVGSSAFDAAVWNGTTALTTYKYVSLTGFSIAVTTYSIAKAATTNGSFTVYEKSMADETVTISAAPDSGYEVDTVTVTDADSGNVAVSGTGNTRSFTMPAKNVTVAVTFKTAASTVPVAGVSLDKDTLALTVGGEETLTATVAPDNATNKAVTWSSSDDTVAAVVDGKVTAVAAGTATITVTTADGSFTDTCEVTVSAASPTSVSLMNNGYPYGKDMTSSSVTLVMDVANADINTEFKWQSCGTKDGTYADITGETGNTLTLSSPTSGTWYRCVVNGTLTSKAVQVVTPTDTNTADANGYYWTEHNEAYYVTNGTVAYMVNGYYFDVAGLYVKAGKNYMIQTSYSEKWEMYSNTSANPSAHSYGTPNAELDALRVSFDEADVCAVYFEADLADSHQAFSFGTDTQLGNRTTSGSYSDSAALIGTVENGTLKQVAMIGAASEAEALESDPAFFIAPASKTPASKFWIGHYSDRMVYGSSTDTKIENGDSGMTMSWLNVTSGGSVNFIFKVGTAEATGTISGGGVSTSTDSVTLELPKAATTIVVKVGTETLVENTDYTLDTTNPIKPVITFLAAAGLTHESVINVDVTIEGETTPQTVPITNRIPAPTTATVSFDVQGHGTAPADQEITVGGKVVKPADPGELFYIFGGWYADAACTTAWNFETGTVSADMTLYAKWTYNPPVHYCTSKCSICGGCTDAYCT